MFALPLKGYKVDRGYWIDDLLITTYNYDFDTFQRLTNYWPEEFQGDCRLVTSSWQSKLIDHIDEFPMKEVQNFFRTDYINNGTAYAIAHGLYEGVRVFHLWGVDFFDDGNDSLDGPAKRGHHRACVEYWIGRGEGMGATFFICPYSPLMDTMHKTVRGFRMKGYRNTITEKMPQTNVRQMKRWLIDNPEARDTRPVQIWGSHPDRLDPEKLETVPLIGAGYEIKAIDPELLKATLDDIPGPSPGECQTADRGIEE